MIFAEMSETVWLAVIGGVMLVVKQVLDWLGMWFKVIMDRKTAAELKAETAAQAAKVTEHLKSQDEALQTVVRQTNGLIDEVKEKARQEGRQSGEKAALQKLNLPDMRS